MWYNFVSKYYILLSQIILLFVLFSYISPIYCQNSEIEKLKKELYSSTTDTNKINLYISLGDNYLVLKKDSAKYYYNLAYILSEKVGNNLCVAKGKFSLAKYFLELNNYDSASFYFNSSIEIFGLLDKSTHAHYLKEIANIYQDKNLLFQSKKYYEQSLDIFKELNDFEEEAQIFIEIGTINHIQGNYSSSLFYFQKALKYFENTNNKKLAALCYNDIGMVHETQQDYDKALEYFEIALNYYFEVNEKVGYSRTLNNKGICIGQQGYYDSALIYFKQALAIDKLLNDVNGMGLNYMNIGNVKYFNGEIDSAFICWKLGYEFNLQANDLNNAVICINNLAYAYFLDGKYDKAIELFYDIIETSKLYGSKDNIQLAYENLAEIYETKGDYKLALEYFSYSVIYKDSLESDEIQKELLEMETKYEFEQQTQLIELQNIQIDKQEAEINQQKTIKFSIFIVLILTILLALFIFRSNLIKKRANKILLAKNAEINTKNEEILTQNEILHQQKEEISSQSESLQKAYNEIIIQNNKIIEQKEEIERKNFNIMSSIEYAQRIQEAIFTSLDLIHNIFDEYFILYKPRDIVSGDFYFLKCIDNKNVIAVADCTGHGIPGAFMSILGTTLLNEIFRTSHFPSTGGILDNFRESIKKALKQTGKKDEQKDGMDLALCIYNKDNKLMQYSGANLPVIIYRKTEESAELIELKPDKQPISIYLKETPFVTTEIEIMENDKLYLFSDGYQSQFGCEADETFKMKRFKDLILNNGHLTLNEQYNIFIETHNNWKQNKDQVDDILVLGVRL